MAEGDYIKAATEIGNVVEDKNKNYGDSFSKSVDFLKLLYPTGIPVESFADAPLILRIFDKLKRIASNKTSYDEDPYKDLIGVSTRMWETNEVLKDKK